MSRPYELHVAGWLSSTSGHLDVVTKSISPSVIVCNPFLVDATRRRLGWMVMTVTLAVMMRWIVGPGVLSVAARP